MPYTFFIVHGDIVAQLCCELIACYFGLAATVSPVLNSSGRAFVVDIGHTELSGPDWLMIEREARAKYARILLDARESGKADRTAARKRAA